MRVKSDQASAPRSAAFSLPQPAARASSRTPHPPRPLAQKRGDGGGGGDTDTDRVEQQEEAEGPYAWSATMGAFRRYLLLCTHTHAHNAPPRGAIDSVPKPLIQPTNNNARQRIDRFTNVSHVVGTYGRGAVVMHGPPPRPSNNRYRSNRVPMEVCTYDPALFQFNDSKLTVPFQSPITNNTGGGGGLLCGVVVEDGRRALPGKTHDSKEGRQQGWAWCGCVGLSRTRHAGTADGQQKRGGAAGLVDRQQ